MKIEDPLDRLIREFEEEEGRPATVAEISQIAEEYYHG